MRDTKISGGWLVFLGAVFWSFNAPLVKFIQINPLLVSCLRSLIAGIFLSPFIRPREIKLSKWFFIYIVSYAGLCISIVIALRMTPAPIAIGMQYSAIILLSIVSRSKKPQLKKLVSIALIFIGIVLFICSENGNKNWLGMAIALSEGIFFAGITASSDKAAGGNPLGLTAVANWFTGLLVLLFPSVTFSAVLEISYGEWMILLFLGIVQVGLGYGFYNMGLKKVSPQKASILALWEMILGPVWVALLLKEYPAPLVWLGFALILVGMVLYSLGGKSSSAVSVSDSSAAT